MSGDVNSRTSSLIAVPSELGNEIQIVSIVVDMYFICLGYNTVVCLLYVSCYNKEICEISLYNCFRKKISAKNEISFDKDLGDFHKLIVVDCFCIMPSEEIKKHKGNLSRNK